MVGTENHHHHPPPTQAAPAPLAPPLGAARGPAFPPTEQLLQLNYCIHSNPSWPQTVILAFQHYIVMLGSAVMIATMLVPRMGGSPGDKARVIQSLLFMSGVNTLLQTFLGTRLPTVMGPSSAYVISVLAIINDFSDSNFSSEHERFVHSMRAIQGALIVSSFINIILGFGRAWANLTRLFSPVVIVPVVCVVGLGLFGRGFPQLGNCVQIGLPMLILLVVCQQYLKGIHPMAHSILERFALLFCVAFVWAFAAIITVSGAYNNVRPQTMMSCRTDRSGLLSSAPWIRIPYPFQWGVPIFRASHVFGMMGAAIVASAESTGTFFAAARLAGATAPPTHVLTRSVGLQGIGQLLDGIFGAAVGTTASVENVGLLGLTHVGSRRVVQISTAFMIFFSIFGKFGAFFASIPLPIFAAIYCVLYAAIGISFIQFTNNNSMRNIYILGLSLFLRISIPQYFVMNTDMAGHGPVKTDAGWCTSATDFLATYYFSHITAGETLTTPASLNLARHVVDCPSIFPEERYMVDSVFYTDEVVTVLHNQYQGVGQPLLFLLHGLNTDSNNFSKPAQFVGIEKFETDLNTLHPILTECRVLKSDLELAVIQYANDISSEAHVEVMRKISVGMKEYQLESIFLHHTYMYGGCRHCSYTCICATGENSSVLHYGHAAAPNDRTFEDGDMALLDMGAEFKFYGSDITCSFPVNGKFTSDQRLVYNAVLDAHNAVISTMRPGVSWVDMHKLAEKIILESLKKGCLLVGDVNDMMVERLGAVFMPHGLGHLLGIDTHDPGGYLKGAERSKEPGLRSLRTSRELLEGMVVTVEPGCYFIEALLVPAMKSSKFFNSEQMSRFRGFGGVRIESDVYVNGNGCVNMTKCPREVSEIEAVMAGAPWPINKSTYFGNGDLGCC